MVGRRPPGGAPAQDSFISLVIGLGFHRLGKYKGGVKSGQGIARHEVFAAKTELVRRSFPAKGVRRLDGEARPDGPQDGNPALRTRTRAERHTPTRKPNAVTLCLRTDADLQAIDITLGKQ